MAYGFVRYNLSKVPDERSSAPPCRTWLADVWSLQQYWLNVSKSVGLCKTTLLQSSQSEEAKRKTATSRAFWSRVRAGSLNSAEEIHVELLSPFPVRLAGLSHFLVEFVKEGPRTHLSAKEWRWKKLAWQWKESKLGQRSTSQTDGWEWWRWWRQHFPKCQLGHGGKHLLGKKKVNVWSGCLQSQVWITKHTSHIGVHSHAPVWVGVPMSAVHMAAVGVAVAPVAVLAVGVAVVWMTVVVRRAAFSAMGVSVTESAYTHQVDQ